MKKKCVAMLLAGGQGSRLRVLTERVAKPAVPFGGKYRIIDFALSNCTNSDIDTVGVLTQYQPLELNSYIGSGQPWDLDRDNGGVYVLPPFVKEKGGKWYSGTANAILQNSTFIEQFDPDYIMVLSGDHIYKMDYKAMIRYHEEKQAQATIAVIRVDAHEACRFGIMETAEDGAVISFEEKPRQPKSDLASMGVYVFNWKELKPYLLEDEDNAESQNDFGRDVIPLMIRSGARMFAYHFGGYWKDVGTLLSLWEANMDLLTDTPRLVLHDPRWRIYSRNPIQPPHFIGSGAQVHECFVTEGAQVYGVVEHSILFNGVVVEAGAHVEDCVIMPGVRIKKGAHIVKSIVGDNAVIGEYAQVGEEANLMHAVEGVELLREDITVIGELTRIPDHAFIPRGSLVSNHTPLQAQRRKEVSL